jgi:hypothetical protein
MMMVPDHKRSLMFEYTLNITTTWLFGEPHNSMTKEEADTVQDKSDCASFGCGIRVPTRRSRNPITTMANSAEHANPSRVR